MPPLDPAGKPWRVQLLEPRDATYDLVAEAPSATGRALVFPLVGGQAYVLRVRTGEGDIWLTDPEPVLAGATSQTRTLEPKSERVRGLVTVGRRPLPGARLTFSAGAGHESVSFTSKEDGRFTGYLPRFGRWRVLAVSESPHVRAEVDTDVFRNKRGAEIDAEVRLIPEGIEGEVVDIEGRQIASRASLSLNPRGGYDHRNEPVEGGTFRVQNLASTGYYVEVTSSYLDADGRRLPLRSEPQVVTVEHGTADPAWLRLILRRQSVFRGRVVGPSGVGVVSTRAYDVRRFSSPVTYPPVRSDGEGSFVLPILEGLPDTCLALVPPGLPTVLVRRSAAGDEQAIPIGGLGGTLSVDQPYEGASQLDGRVVAVFHAGCAVLPGAFFRLGRRPTSHDAGARVQYTIRNLEPGAYWACPVTWEELGAYAGGPPAFEDCAEGTLVPGERLELAVLP